MLEVILISYAVLVVLSILLMIRNFKVANLRRSIIATIFTFEDTQWRIDQYDFVSYDEMMLKFWKPPKVESFYRDDSFIHH